MIGPALREVIGGEDFYGFVVANTLHGFFTLSSSFQSFYVETLRLTEQRTVPREAKWYWPVVFTHIGMFKGFRASESLLLKGYPLIGYSLFRDLKDRAFMLAAVARGVISFQDANAFIQPASGAWSKSDQKKAVKLRKEADLRIRKNSLGTTSGFESAKQERLDRWNQLFHAEVHGSHLTFASDLDAWLKTGTLRIVNGSPDLRSLGMHTTHFQEVAWMCIRLLPFLQLTPGEFNANWQEKWNVLNESFKEALAALAGPPGEFTQLVIELMDSKFPFTPTSTAYTE